MSLEIKKVKTTIDLRVYGFLHKLRQGGVFKIRIFL